MPVRTGLLPDAGVRSRVFRAGRCRSPRPTSQTPIAAVVGPTAPTRSVGSFPGSPFRGLWSPLCSGNPPRWEVRGPGVLPGRADTSSLASGGRGQPSRLGERLTPARSRWMGKGARSWVLLPKPESFQAGHGYGADVASRGQVDAAGVAVGVGACGLASKRGGAPRAARPKPHAHATLQGVTPDNF